MTKKILVTWNTALEKEALITFIKLSLFHPILAAVKLFLPKGRKWNAETIFRKGQRYTLLPWRWRWTSEQTSLWKGGVGKLDQSYATHWTQLKLWKTVTEVSQLLTLQMKRKSISLQSKTLQSSQKARGISTNAWILTMAVWFQSELSTSLKGCIYIQNCLHSGNNSCRKFFCNIPQATVLFLKKKILS